ncbi:MAG: hypothetical protein KDJ37_05520 [Hyphomicrobiaceae bacterium]|nr:hypothetical protein [Hyphomicrobiaceae bacterium]
MLAWSPAPALAAGEDGPDGQVLAEEGDATANGIKVAAGRNAWGGLTIEGIALAREGLENFPFTTAGSAVNPFIPFTSSALDGDRLSFGANITLAAKILDQPMSFSAFFLKPITLEATATNLGSEAGNIADTDTIYSGNATIFSTNSDNIFALNVHHQTELYGAEANFLQPFGIQGVSLGVRGIYFGETLSSTAMQDADDFPGLGNDDDRDHTTARTDNYLLGVRLGLDHMFAVGDRIRLGGSLKAGLYNNFVTRDRSFISENRTDLRNHKTFDRDNVFSQSLEFKPRIEFKVTDGVYLTATGQAVWLNNVSTALPHYATIGDLDEHNVRANSSVWFYGGSLGLTFQLDGSSPISTSPAPLLVDTSPPTTESVEERISELEDLGARSGNRSVSLTVFGQINQMLMVWDDGAKTDAYVAENPASRSRFGFIGSAKIARGWSAGYFASIGLDHAAANDLDQLTDDGEDQIELRQSNWWVRSNRYGTVTVGLASTATDDIILKDVGGIMPGAANIATMGGSFIVRRSDSFEQGNGALIARTTLNDFSAGASVDTLRRNVVRYDAPRLRTQFGNFDGSVALGEDDFFDASVEYSVNHNDWMVRFGAGYLHDTDENGRANSQRDREEYKGSLSVLHVPTGLFGTAAYVRREFNGMDPSDQAIFGENTTGLVTPAGSNRPPIDYLYTAFGLRRSYWSLGDTSLYGEYAQVDDAITGLREADAREVTDSRLSMFGAAISQDIDAAGMDLYAGVRFYSFHAQGVDVRPNGNVTRVGPIPLTDLMLGYAGARIKF